MKSKASPLISDLLNRAVSLRINLSAASARRRKGVTGAEVFYGGCVVWGGGGRGAGTEHRVQDDDLTSGRHTCPQPLTNLLQPGQEVDVNDGAFSVL